MPKCFGDVCFGIRWSFRHGFHHGFPRFACRPSNSSTGRSWSTACCGASAVLRCKQAATRMSAVAARWSLRFHQPIRWTGHLWIPMGQNGEWVDDGCIQFIIFIHQQLLSGHYSYHFLSVFGSVGHQAQIHFKPTTAPGSYRITWKHYARASSCRAPPGAADTCCERCLFPFLGNIYIYIYIIFDGYNIYIPYLIVIYIYISYLMVIIYIYIYIYYIYHI